TGKVPSSAEEGMWRAATAVAERHWGGASRCDPTTDLALLRPFEPPPPWPVAVASPPCSRRGALVPSFPTENHLVVEGTPRPSQPRHPESGPAATLFLGAQSKRCGSASARE